MGISPISAGGINPTYNVSTVTSAAAPAAKSVESNASATPGDQVSLGEESAAPKKKGLLQWLKDLVKTEVEGPSEPYIDRTCRRLEEIMANAQPGDIPDSMPQHDHKGGEPTDYYIPGGGAHSGISIPIPSEQMPTMADVADFHTISFQDAVDIYRQEGLADKLSPVQKGVIKEYCGQSFMAMNGHLLDGEDNAAGTVDKAVRCAAGALDKGEVPSGIILNRCASMSELLNYCSKEDYAKFKKFADKGKMERLAKLLNEKLTGVQTDRKTFISTSVGPKADFMDKPKIATRFYIGEGVKGAFVSADPQLIKFNGENEYLLAPNMQSTVMGVEYNPETKGLTMHVFLGDK